MFGDDAGRLRSVGMSLIQAVSTVAADRLLVAVAVVVVAAWGVGRVVQRFGQPAVLGEILAGILLGPSVLGALWPSVSNALFPAEVIDSLRALAEIGLVLFMFVVGIEVDLALVRRSGRQSAVISQTAIVVPALVGFAVSPLVASALMPESSQPGFGLFIGAAMSITAFPVLARILQQMNLDRTRPGVLAITCAAIGDVAAWCLLAVTVAVVQASGAGGIVFTLAAGAGFTAGVWWILRPLLGRAPPVPLPVAVGLALVGAWITSWIGIHAIFGAFIVGVAMPRTEGRAARTARQLEVTTTAILLPLFFVVAGLAVEIGALGSPMALLVTIVVVVVASLGKLGGTAVSARCVGMTWSDAAGLGLLMNTRGLTEIVILAVGLQLGVINGSVYSAMVVMALVTTLVASPVLEATGIAARWRAEVDIL